MSACHGESQRKTQISLLYSRENLINYKVHGNNKTDVLGPSVSYILSENEMF